MTRKISFSLTKPQFRLIKNATPTPKSIALSFNIFNFFIK